MVQKMTTQTLPLKRRGFLRAVGRYGVALGAAIGGLALFRRNGGPVAETACRDPQGRTGCGSCGILASCGLVRGLSYKQVRKDGTHGR